MLEWTKRKNSLVGSWHQRPCDKSTCSVRPLPTVCVAEEEKKGTSRGQKCGICAVFQKFLFLHACGLPSMVTEIKRSLIFDNNNLYLSVLILKVNKTRITQLPSLFTEIKHSIIFDNSNLSNPYYSKQNVDVPFVLLTGCRIWISSARSLYS